MIVDLTTARHYSNTLLLKSLAVRRLGELVSHGQGWPRCHFAWTERLPHFVKDASGLHGDLLTLSQPSCLTLYDTLNHGAEKTCIVSYISVINGRYE